MKLYEKGGKKASCHCKSYKVYVYKRSTNVNEKLMSQLSYCPPIWMCHSRKINNQINKLHERALRLVYNDKGSSFRKLLERDKSVTIHERNIQVLLTEIFKVKSSVAPEIMTEIFKFKDYSYDLKNNGIESY